MTGIELVVTDLDGTLWEDARNVHPRTVEALSRLDAGGIPLLVATGRRIASTRAPLAAIGIEPPAVVLNGAIGLDLATDERFHEHAFDPDHAAEVLAAFGAWDVDPCVYVDHNLPVRVSDRPSTHPDHLASFGEEVGQGVLTDVVATEQVLAFGLLGVEEAVVRGVADSIGDRARTHVDRDRAYGGWTITVAPADRSKWDGVAAFCASRGIDPGSVLAIGDGPNDVELLSAAAVAVAPADAHPAARAAADHVVGRAQDGGWAELLDLLSS